MAKIRYNAQRDDFDRVDSSVTTDMLAAYQLKSEREAAGGYAGLDAGGLIRTSRMGTGAASSASFLRGDRQFVSFSGYLGTLTPLRPVSFAWASNSSITMAASGIDSGLVHLFNGTSWIAVTIASTLTFDFATGTGAIGGSEAAEASDRMYYLYIAAKDGGTNVGLYASETADPASVTFPGGYSYYSKPLLAFRNDASGNIVDFIHSPGGWTRYKSLQMALSAGLATSATAIDLSKYVPDIDGTEVESLYRSTHSGSTERYTQILRNATSPFATHEGLGAASASGLKKKDSTQIKFPLHSGGAAASLYYLTSGALTGTGAGVKLQITGFKLP